MSYQYIDEMQGKEKEIEREKERETKDHNLCLYPNIMFLLPFAALSYLDLNRI